MTIQSTSALIDEIIGKRIEYLSSKIKRNPANNFRASDIHECNRYLVHTVLDWEKRSMHDYGLQAIFDRGNDEERLVTRDLAELGYNFIQQQTPIEIKNNNGELLCRGSIDGKILYKGEAIPCEIKSMNMNTFNSIRSINDFQKKPLHRKYLRQMNLYLYGNNEEAGIFILSNLQGSYKFIPIVLDYGECETILQRLEFCWGCVKKKEYPARIEYTESLCGKCAFAHVCLQEVKNEGAKFIENEELEIALSRRKELAAFVSEYKEIDEHIKETFKNIPEVFVGKKWQIIGKESIGERLDTKLIPDDVRKPYMVEFKRWIMKIIEMENCR